MRNNRPEQAYPTTRTKARSAAQSALQAAWRSEHRHGWGAVIAAYAHAATLGHFDWHTAGQAQDPIAFARDAVTAARRNGTFAAA